MNHYTANTDNDPGIATGTSLVGYVRTTRAKLERVFGKPTFDGLSADGKVTAEWVITWENGAIATIYDWKRYDEGAPGRYEVIEWHVGGHSPASLTLVREALDKQKREDADVDTAVRIVEEAWETYHPDGRYCTDQPCDPCRAFMFVMNTLTYREGA